MFIAELLIENFRIFGEGQVKDRRSMSDSKWILMLRFASSRR